MDKSIIEPTLSIPAFYSGRSILITGGSGYLGKVLIEKLLRSCPNIGEIFLLIRPKNNASIDKRLQELLSNPLFNKLRSEQSHCFKKLVPVKGDISLENLGLSLTDRDMLIEKVSIIFHVAATVRFDDTLRNAVFTNLRSTRDICILGERMKNLIALIHISSTYAQVDKLIIDEIVYPIDIDWKKTIQVVEVLDEYMLEIFKSKYIGTMPNQYVFTKRLAEQVIADYSRSLPCVICRPSVVTPTLNEPVKGWVDNFNGPVAIWVGSGKGILRVFHCDSFASDNNIPIDIVVKAMIVAAWKCGVTINSNKQNILPSVYNCSANHTTNLSRLIIMKICLKVLAFEIPLENIIWIPGWIGIKSDFFYRMLVLLLHVMPALFIDMWLQLTGRRPRLLNLQRKIFISNYTLLHFLLNEWNFRNKKMLNLSSEIPPDDQKDFEFMRDLNYNFDKMTYFRNCIIGGKNFLLHEDMNQLDAAKAHYKRMVWIDRIMRVLVSVLFIWIIYKYMI